MTWQTQARALHAKGVRPATIARDLGVSKELVYRLLIAGYAERRAEKARAWRARNPERNQRYRGSSAPEILPTETTVVKERCDGTRISLPRVMWLERPDPRIAHP